MNITAFSVQIVYLSLVKCSSLHLMFYHLKTQHCISYTIVVLLLLGTPTIKTGVLRLVSSVQLVKRLLLANTTLPYRDSQHSLLLRPRSTVILIVSYKETEKQ